MPQEGEKADKALLTKEDVKNHGENRWENAHQVWMPTQWMPTQSAVDAHHSNRDPQGGMRRNLLEVVLICVGVELRRRWRRAHHTLGEEKGMWAAGNNRMFEQREEFKYLNFQKG